MTNGSNLIKSATTDSQLANAARDIALAMSDAMGTDAARTELDGVIGLASLSGAREELFRGRYLGVCTAVDAGYDRDSL